MRAYFWAYHFRTSGPAWWCQHPVWHWIHSELWCSPSKATLSSFAVCCLLQSPVCIHIFWFLWPVACPLLYQERSPFWQWAVVRRAAGMVWMLSWEGRPRLTQVTLELEALTEFMRKGVYLCSFVTGRFSPSIFDVFVEDVTKNWLWLLLPVSMLLISIMFFNRPLARTII